MLDVLDFIADKGGNPAKIKESQRKRSAPEEAVDEVIALYEDHRKSESTSHRLSSAKNLTDWLIANYAATQLNTKINETQKQIGMKKKVR